MGKIEPEVLDSEKLESSLKRVKHYLESQFKDGWWPYKPGMGPSIEATSWCSLYSGNEISTLQALCKFLATNQNADGGWSSAPDEEGSAWMSGPAFFALRRAAPKLADKSELDPVLKHGLAYFLGSRTVFYSGWAEKIAGLIDSREVTQGRGWPWSPGCFHWVEPTSYNLFALKNPNLIGGDEKIIDTIKSANKYLIDNTCSVGGWNHGSHVALGVNLPPYIVTTAEALLALQDLPHHPAVLRGFDFLESQSEAVRAGQASSAMALAWLSLVYHAYGKPNGDKLSQLIKGQNADGSFGPNMMVTGLSAIALDTENGANPFKFSWSNPKTEP